MWGSRPEGVDQPDSCVLARIMSNLKPSASLSESSESKSAVVPAVVFVCGQNTVDLWTHLEPWIKAGSTVVRSLPEFNRPADQRSTQLWSSVHTVDFNTRPDALENVQLARFAESVLHFPIRWANVDPLVLKEAREKLPAVQDRLEAAGLWPEWQPLVDSLKLLIEYAANGDDRLWELFVDRQPNRDMTGLYGSLVAVQHLDLSRLHQLLQELIPKKDKPAVTTAHEWRWFAKLLPAAPGVRIPVGCFTDLRNLVAYSGLPVVQWVQCYPRVNLPDAVAADMEHDDLLVLLAVRQAKPAQFIFQFPDNFDPTWCLSLAQSLKVPFTLYFDEQSKNHKALKAVQEMLPIGLV